MIMADDFKRTRDRVAKHCCLGCKGSGRKLGNKTAPPRLYPSGTEQTAEAAARAVPYDVYWAEVNLP